MTAPCEVCHGDLPTDAPCPGCNLWTRKLPTQIVHWRRPIQGGMTTLSAIGTDNTNLDSADGSNYLESYANHSDILHIDTSLSIPDIALDNMPTDFVSMDTLFVNAKARKSTAGDDRLTVAFKIKDGPEYTDPPGIANPLAKDAGGVSAADSSEVEGDSSSIDSWLETHNDLTASWVTTGAIEFPTVDTSATKTTWDGAYVWIQVNLFKTKGSDGATGQIDWCEFTGTYTASAGGTVERAMIAVGAFPTTGSSSAAS